MDAFEHDILGFLKQNIIRKLMSEAECCGLPVTHPEIIRITMNYFNLGPHPHWSFETLVTVGTNHLGESLVFS